MNNRVYNDKVNVDDKNIKAFFNNRAKKFAAGEVNQYTSVVLGDNKPDYGKEWHEFEKKQVVQHLNLGPDKKVLDIGCGIGRWAENIIDHCGEYIRTDFSDEMIKSAGERFKSYSNALFINSSFQDIFKNKKISVGVLKSFPAGTLKNPLHLRGFVLIYPDRIPLYHGGSK